MLSGTTSISRGRRTHALIVVALLASLAACGGGGGGGGSTTSSTSDQGGGIWDPNLPGPGLGGSPDTWIIGPELDFYPPALTQTYTLENPGPDPLPWNVQLTASWLQLTGPASGTLGPGESVDVQVDALPYSADVTGEEPPSAQVVFKDTSSGTVLSDYDVLVEPGFAVEATFAAGGNNGWTALAPSSDTKAVYVSSSTGNDANDGLTPATAKRTIAAGKAQLTHLKPDWMLLKRGDVWQEALGQWTKSGRSRYEPMVVAWYGTSINRPLLQTGATDGVTTMGSGGAPPTTENVAFIGLHFQANGYDGSGGGCAGARILQPSKHLLFEDCMFQAYHTNMILQGYGGRHEDLRVRRCVIVDAYAKHSANSGHPQGLYASDTDGLLIEENVFDHNGWKASDPDAGPDIFCHNLYINNGNTGVTVRGNIIANASSHGMQLRCGGIAINNLFVQNAIALSLGGGNNPEPAGVKAIVMGNVILEGKDIAPNLPRGWGLWFGNIAEGQAGYNIVANNALGHQPAAVTIAGDAQGDFTFAVGVHDLLLEHNIIRNWGGNIRVEGEDWQITNTNLFALDVQDLTHTTPLMDHTLLTNAAGIESGENRFFSKLVPSSGWSQFEGINQTIDYWMAQVGDTTSEDVLVTYANPDVSVGSYNAAIGGVGTLSAFLTEARKQSFANWHPEYMAVRVNRYVRWSFRN